MGIKEENAPKDSHTILQKETFSNRECATERERQKENEKFRIISLEFKNFQLTKENKKTTRIHGSKII